MVDAKHSSSVFHDDESALTCGSCRREWRIVPEVHSPADVTEIRAVFTAHRCDPRVSPVAVEVARGLARELCAGLPDRYFSVPVGEVDVQEAVRRCEVLEELSLSLASQLANDYATIEAAMPAVPISHAEPWEHVLMFAMLKADG